MVQRAFTLGFHAIAEDRPGPALRRQFEHSWPSYRSWFEREGGAARPSYALGSRMPRRHMPELLPTYKLSIELAGGGDLAARFLSLYCPTPFLSGCSRATWTRAPHPALMMNYDYPAERCGLLLRTAWRGTRVIAMADCLWGVLDGMNEHGLALFVAFGGRKAVGEGFGITLVLRYLLETCRHTAAAAAALERVPVHMAYNIALLDKRADYATVRVVPDREALIGRIAMSASSQELNDWPEHLWQSQMTLREQYLGASIVSPGETLERFVERFLYPPVHRRPSLGAWGILYTACTNRARARSSSSGRAGAGGPRSSPSKQGRTACPPMPASRVSIDNDI
jgi:predicted choloylglycine hydrolase